VADELGEIDRPLLLRPLIPASHRFRCRESRKSNRQSFAHIAIGVCGRYTGYCKVAQEWIYRKPLGDMIR